MNHKFDPILTNTIKMFFDEIILLLAGILFLEFTIPFGFNLFFIFLLGLLYATSGILYFESLKLDDVTEIIPYFQSFSILLIFISSLIFFKETATFINYFGIILILIGVYFILSKKGFKLLSLNKGIYLISIVIILGVTYTILTKSLLYNIKPINLSILMYFFATIILSGYVLVFQKKLITKTKELVKPKNLTKIIITSFFGAFGTLLLYLALSIGDASKVYPIAGAQSMFIFIIGVIFLKEKFYWHRLIGIIFIFIGIYFVSI